METELNDAILNFIIGMAHTRAENKQGAISTTSEESVAIFDELDSLTPKDFSVVYLLYLLGSGNENNLKRAEQKALSAKFAPLEAMAFDPNLHIVLTHGREIWHQQVSHK